MDRLEFQASLSFNHRQPWLPWIHDVEVFAVVTSFELYLISSGFERKFDLTLKFQVPILYASLHENAFF